MSAASAARRDTLSTLAIVVGGVVLLTAGLVLVTARGVLDAGQFAGRLSASLGDNRVAVYVADRLTDAVVEEKPDLIPVRPLILATMTGIVRSDPFRGVVRTAARSTHRAVFERRRIVLSLPDIGILLRSALEQASPALAAKMPPRLEAALTSPVTERRLAALIGFWGLGERVKWAALVAIWLGAALIVAGIALTPDRRRGLVRAGLTLLAVGLGCIAVTSAGGIAAAVLFDDPALSGAAHGVWRAFYGSLRLAGLVVGATGLLLAALGGAVLEAADPVRRARELLRLAAEPSLSERPTARLARAAGLLVAGVLTVIWPAHVAALVAFLGGLALMYAGLRELSVLVGSVSVVAHAVEDARAGQRWPARFAWTAAVIAIGGATWWFGHGATARSVAVGLPAACNGAAALCDRPLNRVVFPAAHNAMSNADIGDWMFPHHEHRLAHQLRDGVRALLVDVHYGIPTGGRVKTDLDDELASRDKLEGAVGPEGTAAAMRIRDRLVGGKDGERGLYFCHGFCELGAYEVVPAFREIRDFLLQQPGEVVIMVIEDYVSPNDLDRVFRESGLFDFVYTGPVTPWPTLHELIAANQRLVVFVESGRAGVPWLYAAFATFQETPYAFHSPDEMNCRPNRGGTTGALFQINNWIETTPAPRPSNAAVVNAYEFLLARARRCARERGHLPNILAVDFYATGDLLRVARTLNGVDASEGAR